MEKQFQLALNGQSVIKADFDLLGETSGLADDRVFAELFRLQPFDGSTVRKGILPYGHAGSANAALIAPNGASGSVLVNPFRAFIGSRTLVGTDAKKNWRDIRSAIGVGSTTLGQVVSFAANASGNARWDLVYAIVAVDATSATVLRKVKDAVSKLITGQNVVQTLVTTVTLAIVVGTPGASPNWPAIPSDSGGNYIVPLGYVRIPNGFGASSTVLTTDIATVAPALAIARTAGGHTLRLANQQYVPTAGQIQTWGSTGARPKTFMPATMAGGDSLFIALDLNAPASHANNSVVDDRDWRGRLCRGVSARGLNPLAWNTGVLGLVPFGALAADSAHGDFVLPFMGQTIQDPPTGGTNRWVAQLAGSGTIGDPISGNVQLYCDAADGGKLKVAYTVTSGAYAFWIDFTAPFENK